MNEIPKFDSREHEDNLNEREEDEIIDAGVKRAQEIARKEGLKIGQVVCHPDDEYAYELKEVEGDEAVVWFPGQNETIKTFPLNELFDPNVARREAVQETANRTLKKHPEIEN